MKKLLVSICVLLFSTPAFAQFNIPTAPTGYKYFYNNQASTVLIKSGRGILHNITMEGGQSGFVTLYDSGTATGPVSSSGITVGIAQGPLIGNFDTTNALFTYTYDISFASGLTVVTTNQTKMTFSYL